MNEQSNFAARLYLVSGTGPAAAEHLAAAFAAAEVACVLIEPTAKLPYDVTTVRPLIATIQHNEAAALLLDDAATARELKADGVHLSPGPKCMERYKTARDSLGPRLIIGAHAGKSRHDAMLLGEAAADYIAFGAPPTVRDRAAAETRRLELVSWWAEIFEVPCVAMDVETPQEATELAAAGADFVAVKLAADGAPSDSGARVRSIRDAIAENHRRATP